MQMRQKGLEELWQYYAQHNEKFSNRLIEWRKDTLMRHSPISEAEKLPDLARAYCKGEKTNFYDITRWRAVSVLHLCVRAMQRESSPSLVFRC